MATDYAWQTCLDLSAMPADKQAQTTLALNWLEQYFPEFNEQIYQIREGQKIGQLGHIKVILKDKTQYDQNTDTLGLSFERYYYLGRDRKIHPMSLNEILVHELEHAVQKTMPNYNEYQEKVDLIHSKILAPARALESYLKTKGGDFVDYTYNAQLGSLAHVDPNVLNDPTYKQLAQKWLTAYKAYRDTALPGENGAMDRANILSQMLGKSPREEYADRDLLYNEMLKIPPTLDRSALPPSSLALSQIGIAAIPVAVVNAITTAKYATEALLYTQPPEVIRALGSNAWDVAATTPLYPMIHGQAGVLKGNIVQMQRDWEAKWNGDTKNITNDEWRLIEVAKGNLLSPEILKTIAPEQKKKVDDVIASMQKDFNSSAVNDGLSATTRAQVDKLGFKFTPDTHKKGWHL